LRIDQEGDFEDLGRVACETTAAANILSKARPLDAGNTVSYDQSNDVYPYTIIFSLNPSNRLFLLIGSPGSISGSAVVQILKASRTPSTSQALKPFYCLKTIAILFILNIF
jgi:hypothetical protein